MAEESTNSDEQTKGTLKAFASQPIILIMLGVLLGNINTIVDFIVPSLEKIFVTKVEIIEIKKDVGLLKEGLDEVKENCDQIKNALIKLNDRKTEN